MTVLRYIHQNQIKVNMVKALEEYKWSSYTEYLAGGQIIDIDFVLGIFLHDKSKAIINFIHYNGQTNEDKCMEYEVIKRIDDIQASEIIRNIA